MSSITLTMPSGWENDFGGNAWRVIRERLHGDSPALADMEYHNILNRTAIDTGALISDLTPEPHTNPEDDTLARVFYGTENQLNTWGRVYMLYQEGGDLGLHTYTNEPRLMIASALTDDLAEIEAWGMAALTGAADQIAGGF